MSKYDMTVIQRRAALLLVHCIAIGGSPEAGATGIAVRIVTETAMSTLNDPAVNESIQAELDGRVERHRRRWRLRGLAFR